MTGVSTHNRCKESLGQHTQVKSAILQVILDLDSLRNRAMGSNALYAADWTPPLQARTEELMVWLQSVLANK